MHQVCHNILPNSSNTEARILRAFPYTQKGSWLKIRRRQHDKKWLEEKLAAIPEDEPDKLDKAMSAMAEE